jgi:1,4-dihydroxy-2-naphthoate octaprenyltransferase
MEHNFQKILKLLKLSATPPTVVYPYPLIPLLILFLSKSNIYNFVISLIFVFFYYSAVNLWNHVNDAEEDVKAGRSEHQILLELKKKIVVIVVLHYISALLLVIFFTNFLATLMFVMCILFTWVYSDKIIFGKYINRFKEHYVTEILTYIVVVPTSTLVLWSFMSTIDIAAISFSILFGIYFISIIVLKDIKDITSDSEAGYKTLAVVYNPRTLLKLSFSLNFLYYITLVCFSVTFILPNTSILGAMPVVFLIYLSITLIKLKWQINIRSAKFIRLYIRSYLTSLVLFIIGAFIYYLNKNTIFK